MNELKHRLALSVPKSIKIHCMSYLVPYNLAFKPGEDVRYRAYRIKEVPDIPDDTYQLQEWYCPNPDCD
jgi:hypothetical protein